MAIEGRVARILSDEGVVLNRGSSHGVREGTRFVIFTELDDVPDPETGGSLGKLELVKARVVATHVQEKMCICSPEQAEARREDEGGEHTLSSEMIAVSMTSRRRQGRLDVDKRSIVGVPRAGPVAVGDRARAVE